MKELLKSYLRIAPEKYKFAVLCYAPISKELSVVLHSTKPIYAYDGFCDTWSSMRNKHWVIDYTDVSWMLEFIDIEDYDLSKCIVSREDL